MNTKHITLAVAGLASFAAAQAVDATDAVARQAAQTASSQAQEVAVRADSLSARTNVLVERIDATEGKLTGLEESFLETKAVVDGLKKLKVSGLLQIEYKWYLDTANYGSEYSQKQGAWSVRRGRVKFTYDAGNGSQFVFQPNFNEKGIETKDAYLQYNEQYLKSFWLRAGAQDIPFGYEIGYSSSAIEYLERSLFERNAMFKDEKDLGLVLGYQSEKYLPWLNFKAGWMNASGVAVGQQDPRNFVGRLGFNVAFNDLGVALDGGASYYHDTKTLADTTKNARGTHYEVGTKMEKKVSWRKDLQANIVGGDLQTYVEIPYFGAIKWIGEIYAGQALGNKENIQRYTGANGTTAYLRNVMGWHGGTVINPVALLPQLQLVYRYDEFDPNTEVAGNDIDSASGLNKGDVAFKEQTFGVNWFVNGNTKLSLHYNMVSNEKTMIKGYKVDRDEDILTFRAQTSF